MTAEPARKVFNFIMIKPSHYDDDGYVIQWAYSWIPSNTLAALYGLALDCVERGVLGNDVEIALDALDETNTRVKPKRIARQIQKSGGDGLVALVGVQSNQYPRALDIARELRALGVQVAIGGFHVSGCLAMLPELPSDLREAMDLGISLFAGEAEGRLESLFRDAYQGELKPLYNYMDELPDLQGTPVPFLPAARVKRSAGASTSFDAGRGCPFMCSFCTIINVQGRKSRFRNADDVEQIIRKNLAQGVRSFFITDDNLPRNAVWEQLYDRMIHLREVDGLEFRLMIQVDTMCHKIPGFIEKSARAGVTRVFIGLENINPESLSAARKGQNRITEYRALLQRWKDVGVTTYAGYILGFPADTAQSIERDLRIIQRELPIDLLEFFILTPLPGSADHQQLHVKGVPMATDMNIYDTEHVTTVHAKMSADEWADIYHRAWTIYYSEEHVETLVRRAKARGVSPRLTALRVLAFTACVQLEKVHPLQAGIFRRKNRADRRPGFPRERALGFYARYTREIVAKYTGLAVMVWRYAKICRRVEKDPRPYSDIALTPVEQSELEELDMFTVTLGAKATVERMRRKQAARAAAV